MKMSVNTLLWKFELVMLARKEFRTTIVFSFNFDIQRSLPVKIPRTKKLTRVPKA